MFCNVNYHYLQVISLKNFSLFFFLYFQSCCSPIVHGPKAGPVRRSLLPLLRIPESILGHSETGKSIAHSAAYSCLESLND